MNLTKCFVAGLCVTALTASAANYLVATNDFEGGTLEGTWTGGINASAIVDASTGVTDANSPIVGVTDSKLLKLDTEGGVWTNDVNQPFSGAPVWADMLVKFVPSEELPTLTEGKLAVAIKLALDGTNYLHIANNDSSAFTWAATTKAISTSEWYRVTVKLYTTEGWSYADVSVNNQSVSAGLILDGTTTLNSIGFQGTGFIDEVAVRDDDPFSALMFAGTIPVTDEAGYLAWLSTNSIAQGAETAGMYNAFLWDVAPDVSAGGSPDLKVSSITVGANVVLTLAADYDVELDVAIVPANLNNGAVIDVLGKVNLADPTWTSLGSPLTFNPVVGANTNQFFKVDIAVP